MRLRALTAPVVGGIGLCFLLLAPPACVTNSDRPDPAAAAASPTAAGIHLVPPVEAGRPRASFVATGHKAMIATAHPLATEAGYQILRAGGNAFDAAVAASFMLGVVRPQSTGIGGGGFLVGYDALAKATLVSDFREHAPAAATRDMYLDAHGGPAGFLAGGALIPKASVNGPLAVAVPGLVKGLVAIQARHGRLTLAQVMQPAITTAAQGFAVYPALAEALEERADVMQHFAGTTKVFFRGGKPLKAGELLVQRDLAWSLRLIAAKGAAAFYEGEIAKRLVAEMRRDGGLVTAADLKGYDVRERTPVTSVYRGHTVVSMPPPSSGGVVIDEILNIIGQDDYGSLGFGHVASVHLLAEAMRRAFADRAEFLGDPGFVKVPVTGLLAPAYALSLRRTIDPQHATPSSQVRPGQPAAYEHPSTSHLSVVDPWGNAVSTTQTVNFGFGSCVVADGTGIVLNDEMDDFSIKPGEPNAFGLVGNGANAVAAGKVPLSSMSPTLVFGPDGQLELVVGSPGGPRIISATLQTIINRIDFHMSLADAVHAARIHHQWLPDELRVEKDGLAPDVAAALARMGHHLVVKGGIGDVQAVSIEHGELTGVSDTRSEGKPMGF